MADTNMITNHAVEKYQSFLKSGELLTKLNWQTFLDINALYAETDFGEREGDRPSARGIYRP